MLRTAYTAVLVSALLLAAGALACSRSGRGPEPGSDVPELTREEAVEIAREHVELEIRSIDAERTTEQGRPVWRITFRGRPPGEGSAVGEVVIVVLDRRTGELVSLAQS
jgi:hypothetical protein